MGAGLDSPSIRTFSQTSEPIHAAHRPVERHTMRRFAVCSRTRMSTEWLKCSASGWALAVAHICDGRRPRFTEHSYVLADIRADSCGTSSCREAKPVGSGSCRDSEGDRSLRPSTPRPHHASSSMVGLASWRPCGRGDVPRLALLGPVRVVPRAPKLPSIRQQGPLARPGPFGTWLTTVVDPR